MRRVRDIKPVGCNSEEFSLHTLNGSASTSGSGPREWSHIQAKDEPEHSIRL